MGSVFVIVPLFPSEFELLSFFISAITTLYLLSHINLFSLCFILLNLLWHALAKPKPRVLKSHLKIVKTFNYGETNLHIPLMFLHIL